ncbi:PAS domain-containing protein [Marinibaculum pumilum]|uniref:histidine kinase n=1 Tax=Marinibaculum pumilum TaxID=1766165 RepID=A0ABV7L0M8_9PROT
MVEHDVRKIENLEYKRLFKAAPTKLMLLKPGSYEIVAVTAAYLQSTMRSESDLVGKRLFEVFPDVSADTGADGVENLTRSLRRVELTKMPDSMGVQRHPIRRPNGEFEERFWSPVNSPILDDDGNIELIAHRVEDVTSIVREGHASTIHGGSESRLDPIALSDIILQSQELRQALVKLQEHESRMRTAERLLKLGAWEYDLKTEKLNWSRQVFDIYGVPADRPAPDFKEYFALVHPDDRKDSLAVYQAFIEQGATQIEFEHRVIGYDGRVNHVRGVGERHLSSDGEIVVGYVQDITPLVGTRERLSQAEKLLRLAGEKVRLGGWHVDLDTETITWTPETANIHGLPGDYSPPDVSEAIGFYSPEYREVIRSAFERCARDGEEFDVVCRLMAADGRQPWVRSIGVPVLDRDGKITAVQGAFQDITILQEAQMRADRAERQRLNVLESISDAFFALDGAWHFTYLNDQARILLERSSEELLGKSVWLEFPEAIGSEFERQYRLAVESNKTVKFVEFYPPLQKWFDVSAYPIPGGLAVYFRDVTGDQARQEQLRLVEAALARQNDIVMITDADALDAPDGPRIVYVNDAFERLTGYARKDVIGQTPRLLQGPGTNRLTLHEIREALQNRKPIRCEVLNYDKSGKTYWLELDITPLFSDGGRCTHFVAVERDVTERKQQEDELRLFRERIELISRAANDVIWDWNLTTDEVWWSEAIADGFGYPASVLEPGSDSWTRRIHQDDFERVTQSIYDAIDADEDNWSSEYRFIKSDGQAATVIDRGFIIRDASGKAVRMVGSMLDITERYDMERQLREAQKMEAVGHLTGGIAHDFNNLLTVIMGNAQMLASLTTDPKQQRMAELTVSAAERGAQLTDRLLAFARRRPLDPKPTNINLLIEEMQGLIRRTLPENIDLEIVPAHDLGIAEVDAGELDAALLNLVVNARDAMQDGGKMQDGGRLTIETANVVLDQHYADRHLDVLAGEYVMVSVSDTGTGMDPETVRRAFEPFFTTKGVGKGSGLGLSMVFGFTKQSRGHIKIYSEPGNGTSIKLYFPRIQSGHVASFQPVAGSILQGGTEHILIAEDDDLVLESLKDQLLSLGYRVTAVMSGPEALKALQVRDDIDLLLSDIVMPGGMNGRQLADRARSLRPSLKVIFTSGYTENAIVHHGRLDHGVVLLSKPYTRLELAAKLRLVLDS